MRYRFQPTNDTTVDVEIERHKITNHRQDWKFTFSVNGSPVFIGDDMEAFIPQTEDQVASQLLGILCCPVAYIYPEDFARYTPQQKAWARSSVCKEMEIYVDNLAAIRNAQVEATHL